ncbi:CD1871A family CXXC motif-containing protein [Haloimpatiens sp. FM7330]
MKSKLQIGLMLLGIVLISIGTYRNEVNLILKKAINL